MSSVYVVTKGQYSDYHIVAVFSTEKSASDYLATIAPFKQDWDDDYGIEPYALDEVPPLPTLWRVEMDADSGNDAWFSEAGHSAAAGAWFEKRFFVRVAPATSREQAIKAANEVRTQMIANGEERR